MGVSSALDIRINGTPSAPVGIDLDPSRLEFGKIFSPNWFVAEYKSGSWQDARVEALRNISLHPAAVVLHYGQSIFEGMKAYRWPDGRTVLFRPHENARRFRRSAERMAIPPVDEELFVEAVRALVKIDSQWVPPAPGSMYIRPTIIGDQPSIGVHSSRDFMFFILMLPVGNYFPAAASGDVGSVAVFVAESTTRSSHGGTGAVKASANYAISLRTIEDARNNGCSQVLFLDSMGKRTVEELGGMNVFFVLDGKLITPPLHDTILPGVTRDSIIQVARDLNIPVEEKTVNIDEAADQIRSGHMTEAFACGTAAVIAGIKELLFESGPRLTIGTGNAGEITRRLSQELLGIQFGHIPDRHHWTEVVA